MMNGQHNHINSWKFPEAASFYKSGNSETEDKISKYSLYIAAFLQNSSSFPVVCFLDV